MQKKLIEKRQRRPGRLAGPRRSDENDAAFCRKSGAKLL